MTKRESDRRRVLKGITISFGNNFCVSNGIMRNISETGAYIEFTDSFLVPDNFTIFNDLDGYKVDCRVVRRDGNSAGFEFVGEKEIHSPTRMQVVEMVDERAFNDTREPDNQPKIEDLEPQNSNPAKRQPVFGKRI